MRYVLTVIGILSVLGASAVQAADDDPAALVLEVDGTAPPGLEEFAPIEAGAAYVLPGSTTVAFNHMGLCQTIRVKGGILIVTNKDFSNPGGEVVSTEKAECPEKIALKSEGVVGGVRLRSFKQKPKVEPAVIRWALPIRPVIFLRGKRAGSVDRIKVETADGVVINLPVSRDPVVWPAKAASLAHDTPYLVKLESKKSAKLSETWVRTAGKNVDRKSAVVFLYVD